MRSKLNTIALLTLCVAVPVCGQQSGPVEYIESTSPLPGGGFVSSVFYPGQTVPGHLDETSLNVPLVAQQSVLNQQLPANAAPAATAPVQYVVPQAAPAWNVPTLGIPAAWDRSMRAAGCACRPNTVAQPQLAAPPRQYIAPPQQYIVPPAATQPPTLGQTGYRTALNPVVTNGNAVQIQNMPPNTYMGRGVFGGPSQYVDGQPVRNLFKFISH
ncbi:MAG: hypothetical protein ACR2NP_06430 [Pirellulaceae bacterium]